MAENPTQRLGHARRRIRNIGLTLLLAFELLVFFVLVPITGLALFSPPSTMIVAATLVVIAAVITIAQNRVVLVVTLVTAACALSADFYRVEWPSRYSDSAFLLIALVFFVVLTGSVSFLVFRQGRITPHRVTGAIVIYLHVAVIFTYLYAIVLIFAPGALGIDILTSDPSVGAKILYFSFTTLTTVGYGDITPVHPFARSLSNLEAILGQLYPATLLARLVTLELASRDEE